MGRHGPTDRRQLTRCDCPGPRHARKVPDSPIGGGERTGRTGARSRGPGGPLHRRRVGQDGGSSSVVAAGAGEGRAGDGARGESLGSCPACRAWTDGARDASFSPPARGSIGDRPASAGRRRPGPASLLRRAQSCGDEPTHGFSPVTRSMSAASTHVPAAIRAPTSARISSQRSESITPESHRSCNGCATRSSAISGEFPLKR